MLHRTERLRVAWSIGRLAVSGDASSGPGNLWEACLLPDCAWQVPNNCVSCVAAGGGDYDGDLLQFTSDRGIL